MKKLFFLTLSLSLLTSCVKEEGKVTSGRNTDDTGTTSGGTTGGNNDTSGPDPFASEAWHLNNTGQTAYSTSAADGVTDLNLTGLALSYTGSGVRVAVSDTGTEYSHEDLVNNSLNEHRNYAPADPSEWRQGYGAHNQGSEYHGTSVTGLICAEADNGKGSKGVAPDAKFAAFRFVISYDAGITNASYLARVIDQTDGNFDIFNYSYGYSQCYFSDEDSLVFDALKDGVTSLRNGKGAIYIQSAGNDFASTYNLCLGSGGNSVFYGNTNYSSTLAVPYKIVVGAINANGTKSTYSTPGSSIWVSAPGGEFGTSSPAMVTTDVSGCAKGYSLLSGPNSFNNGGVAGNLNCNYTSRMNGTSSAAPVTSGVVALMLEANPNLTWREIKHILADTADKMDDTGSNTMAHPVFAENRTNIRYDNKWTPNTAGFYFSNWYGFGRINAEEAVAAAKNFVSGSLGTYVETVNPGTADWYYSSGTNLNTNIPDDGTSDWVFNDINVNHNFIIEAVQVKVTLTHTSPKDIALKLVSPDGTESRLLHYNSNVYAASFPADHLMLTNAFYGEKSLGLWRLGVVDGKAGTSGKLQNWKINIHGRKVTPDGTTPNPITALAVPTPYPSSSVTPPISFTNSSSVDVVRYEVSVGTTSGGTEIQDWTTVSTNTNAQITGLSLTDNVTYYVNVRAVDNKENTSNVVSKSWVADFL